MTPIYLFSLIVGGVLLAFSIILGGKDADLDADGDLDLDGDLSADLDADGGFDKGIDLDHSTDIGGGDFDLLWMLKSVRFWTFFLTFFGATGVVLGGLGLVNSWILTLAAAIGMGSLSGYGIAKTVRVLSADDAGAAAGKRDFIGKTARVLVPLSKDEAGQVRVQVKGSTVDLMATADTDFSKNDEVMIIEMHGGRARVAKFDAKS
jgi:membrane protein implicated in regulation of membrane protease activity